MSYQSNSLLRNFRVSNERLSLGHTNPETHTITHGTLSEEIHQRRSLKLQHLGQLRGALMVKIFSFCRRLPNEDIKQGFIPSQSCLKVIIFLFLFSFYRLK